MPSVQAQTQPARPLTFTEIAHELGTHPSAPTRWAIKGVRLRDGSLLKLEAIALPGSWRVTRESLDRFLAILTADRTNNTPAAATTPNKPRSSHQAQVHAGLVENGLI
jgi:hypothetical protein